MKLRLRERYSLAITFLVVTVVLTLAGTLLFLCLSLLFRSGGDAPVKKAPSPEVPALSTPHDPKSRSPEVEVFQHATNRKDPHPAAESAVLGKPIDLADRMRTDSQDLVAVSHGAGHVSVDLSGRFTHMSAGFKDASGRLVIQCFTDFDSMSDALGGKTTSPVDPTEPVSYAVSNH